MFERFTDRARQVIVQSQVQARALNHNWIGTEHILLGLVRESDGVGAQVLAGFGVGVNGAREQVIELLARRRERNRPASTADDELVSRLASVATRLSAIEQRFGPTPSG